MDTSKLLKLLCLFVAADQLNHLAESNIDVQEPQTTEGTPEIGIIPQVLKLNFVRRKQGGKMVQGPRIHPWEYHQESTNLKSEDGE